jgi:hypothetical protein
MGPRLGERAAEGVGGSPFTVRGSQLAVTLGVSGVRTIHGRREKMGLMGLIVIVRGASNAVVAQARTANRERRTVNGERRTVNGEPFTRR